MLVWSAFFLGIFSWLAYMRMTHRAQERAAAFAVEISKRIKKVNREIDIVIGSLDILSSHSDRYFHSLQSAGLPELNEICELLHDLSVKLTTLQSEGRLEDCNELCRWLQDTDEFVPFVLRDSRNRYAPLIDWQDRARAIIISCTSAMAAAAEENAQIGVKRDHRKRAPTLYDLRTLRDEILRR